MDFSSKTITTGRGGRAVKVANFKFQVEREAKVQGLNHAQDMDIYLVLIWDGNAGAGCCTSRLRKLFKFGVNCTVQCLVV